MSDSDEKKNEEKAETSTDDGAPTEEAEKKVAAADEGEEGSDKTTPDDAGSNEAVADEDSDDQDSDEEGEEDEEDEADERSGAADSKSSSSMALLIGALSLAAGFGIGWFGHDFQVNKAADKANAAVVGEGEGARGPCRDWQDALCGALGENSHACAQAKSAGAVLTGSACAQAQESLTATVEKIKKERASCTEMENKLCAELGGQSKACELVRKQTPSFAPDRCTKMMEQYDQVLAQLKMMEERGAIPGMAPGHPGGPGGPGGPPRSISRAPTADQGTNAPAATKPAP